jgi:hypothetical protein
MTVAIKKMGDAFALPTQFVDLDGKSGIPTATFMNACVAIRLLGTKCSYDSFHDKRYIGGVEMTTDASGQVSDEACLALRNMCRNAFKFDPGKNNMWDAVQFMCRLGVYHPVKDYLNSVKHGGKPRIDTWMIDYMGAPDTPFVRAVGRMMLVASVRRVMVPGTKFDYICVLESPEGFNKSSALAALYGAENFSDQSILGLTDKELQEAVRGRWGMEAADLSGMRKAEIEKIKAQLSRQIDRTRPAYGRAVIDAPRCVVFWGTTNDEEYLRSQTGNRRFLPVPVGRIDVAAIERDRDQLWAEAVDAEIVGEDIMLPKPLWAAAAAEQDARTQWDPWQQGLRNIGVRAAAREKHNANLRQMGDEDALALGAVYQCVAGQERVSSHYLLTEAMQIPLARQTAEDGKRVGMVVRKDGWQGPKPMRIGGETMKGYWRDKPSGDPWD